MVLCLISQLKGQPLEIDTVLYLTIVSIEKIEYTLTNAYFADSGCSSRMVFLHFSKKNQISTSILMYTVEFTLYYRVLRYRFPNGGLHTVSLQLKVLKSWNRNCQRNYCRLLITSSNDVNRRKMGQKSRETVSLDMNPFINGFIFK